MILDRFRLTDKVAIVTGAGRGIGAASAVALAEAGADVAIAARTRKELDRVAGEVRAAGRRALLVEADLADTKNLAALADAARAELGRVDVVVNNVGGTVPRPFLDCDDAFLAEAFHFNVTTAIALSRAAVPHLLEQGGGAIVNIGSTMGRLKGRGFLAYGAAKAALAHATRIMAADLCPRIRVNAIAVGATATSALEFVVANHEIRSSMERATPLRRIGDPEDIAAGVVYLASPASAYVTGKILEIDGGIEAPNFEMPLPDLE